MKSPVDMGKELIALISDFLEQLGLGIRDIDVFMERKNSGRFHLRIWWLPGPRQAQRSGVDQQ